MPKKINNIIKISLITVMSAVLVVQVADAAVLSTIYDRLSFIDQDLATGVDHNVVFTTVGACDASVSGYAVLKLQFPDADDTKWCRTVGSDDFVVTGTTEDTSTVLPGTLTGKCVQGTGASNYDTIYICATGAQANWLATTKYAVQIKDGATSKLGTAATAANNIKVSVVTGTDAACGNPGTPVDTGEYALSILADGTVAVSATVDPLLSFAVTDLDIGFGTFSSTAKRYANSDKSGDTSEAGNDEPTKITVSTNAANGLVVSARSKGDSTTGAEGNGSAGLYKSAGTTRLIPAATAASITTGTEGYALYVKNEGANLTVSASWLDESATGTISTTGQTIISTAGTISTLNTADVALEAAIATDTLAGSYADIITLTGTGKF
jgi:hypothetical protein